MPKGTKVDNQYEAMVAKGVPKSVAAATAQKRTGQNLHTGKPIKGGKKGGAPNESVEDAARRAFRIHSK